MKHLIVTKIQFVAFILLSFLNFSQADKCNFRSVRKSVNSFFEISAEYNEKKQNWFYIIHNLETGQVKRGVLPQVTQHAHLYFYLSKDDTRFMVIDADAGHRLKNRVMIFDMKGKLIAKCR